MRKPTWRQEQQLEICTSVCPHYLRTLARRRENECKIWLEDRNEPTSLQPLFESNFNLLSVFVSKFIGSDLCCLHNWRSWSFDWSCSPAEIDFFFQKIRDFSVNRTDRVAPTLVVTGFFSIFISFAPLLDVKNYDVPQKSMRNGSLSTAVSFDMDSARSVYTQPSSDGSF